MTSCSLIFLGTSINLFIEKYVGAISSILHLANAMNSIYDTNVYLHFIAKSWAKHKAKIEYSC